MPRPRPGLANFVWSGGETRGGGSLPEPRACKGKPETAPHLPFALSTDYSVFRTKYRIPLPPLSPAAILAISSDCRLAPLALHRRSIDRERNKGWVRCIANNTGHEAKKSSEETFDLGNAEDRDARNYGGRYYCVGLVPLLSTELCLAPFSSLTQLSPFPVRRGLETGTHVGICLSRLVILRILEKRTRRQTKC